MKTIMSIKSFYYTILISIGLFSMSGCVLINRPSPPKLSGIPFVDKDFATVTVVRKRQLKTSGIVYTLALDGDPFISLEHGQYTSFRVSPGHHMLSVIWDLAGFVIIVPLGGFGDSSHRLNKEIDFQCDAGNECFVTLEGQVFSKDPKDLVFIYQVEKLEDDFLISDKSFVKPLVLKQK